MATDAMDWTPTVQPNLYNPYSLLHYMPGGWPASPPPFTFTAGVFTRKRKSAPILRAAKRVCFGIWSCFRCAATIISKPAYIIVREVRARSRAVSRIPRRRSSVNSSRSTGIQSRTSTNINPYFSAQQTTTQTQVPTPPSTPPPVTKTYVPGYGLGTDASIHKFTSNQLSNNTEIIISGQITNTKFTSVSSLSETDSADYTPATSNSTDTNTPSCDGYYVPKSHVVTSPSIAAARAGIKRRRSRELDPQDVLIALQDLVASDHIFTGNSMKGPNPFEGGQRRPSTPKAPPATIGIPLPSPEGGQSYAHPWSVAKPIKISPPPSPSSQLHDDLSTYVSDCGEDTFEENLQKSPEMEAGSSSQSGPHDDRWFSVPVMGLFSPKVGASDDFSTSTKPGPDAQPAWAMSGLRSRVSKLFYPNETQHTPPPVRSRSVVTMQGLQLSKNEPPAAPLNAEHAHLESPIPPVAAATYEDPAIKSNEDDILRRLNIPTWTQAEVDEMHRSKAVKRDSQPKANISTPDQQDTKPAARKVDPSFETPSEKLSKLDLNAADTDTPKAGYHSDTKTVRKTRYREAYEKLQRAKLEEYELVPITDPWDKKVRSAVRTGIPDYLGPHDLARVVPQYAGRNQDNWLNDETINKYLEIVAAHGRKSDRPEQIRTHHAFNNFFYNNLRDKGPESVMRWSKRAKIGGKALAQVEKVFIPINSGAHWTLAVVEPKEKRITHYNSMRGTATGIKACEDLKKWVAAELGKDFKENEWTLTSVGESPQQTNSDDCGVFTITSARQIMLGYTPMSYGPSKIPVQRVRIVAELINRGLLKSSEQ